MVVVVEVVVNAFAEKACEGAEEDAEAKEGIGEGRTGYREFEFDEWKGVLATGLGL